LLLLQFSETSRILVSETVNQSILAKPAFRRIAQIVTNAEAHHKDMKREKHRLLGDIDDVESPQQVSSFRDGRTIREQMGTVCFDADESV
jgi:hypothetical protein